MKNILPILGAALLISGCAATQIQQQRQILINQGQPLEYVDGYGDGYSSGMRAAGNSYFSHMKNVIRFRDDDFYKQGWTDGYHHAKTSYSNLVEMNSRY